MKRSVWVFGLLSGLVITGFMVAATMLCYDDPDFEGNEVVGYAGMIAAFAFVFVGIKNYRDKYCGGTISFGKAFKTGFLITLIASTMYVGVWLIEYYIFIPDFMEKYSAHVLNSARAEGASASELAAKEQEMNMFSEYYKNPLFVILITFAEVLPVGLIVTLISALLLKRKTAATA